MKSEFLICDTILHTLSTLQLLREQTDAFQASMGLQVLFGAADAHDSTERLEIVFLRADDALALAKDSVAGIDLAA